MANLNDILGGYKKPNPSLPQKIDYVQSLGRPTGQGYSGGGSLGSSLGVGANKQTGGGGAPQQQQQQVQQQQQPQGDQRSEQQRYEDSVRDSINSGYDNYFSYLDELTGTLPGQANNQNQIIQNTTNQNISDLDASTNASRSELDTQERKLGENQVKNLRDLSDNIINQGLAGSIMLGSKGAGDSSATGMYSYALQKMGNKQRGDIISQTDSYKNDIADREAKINNIYTQEKSRINTDSQNKLLEVASWLSSEQNRIKGMKASGQLEKGKDLAALSSQLLSQATQRAQQIYNDAQSRSAALESWAMSNSKNVQELKSNLSSLSTTNYSMPQASNLVASPQVDSTGNISAAPIGLGYQGGDGTKKDAFGRPLQG